MSLHLRREIDELKKKILGLGSMVEDNVRNAVQSVLDRDEAEAERIINTDTDVDMMEVEIEEDCLKILALHQPVAIDLRYIVSVLKINNDLERIGDLAANIAERGSFLATQSIVFEPMEISVMAEKAQDMLTWSLDSLINSDAQLARKVLQADDEVDDLNRVMHGKVRQKIRSDIEYLSIAPHVLDVSRHLERIADLATNIAEDVIYMIEGRIVRHVHSKELS